MQKIEAGNCDTDIRLMQMLISRLGKSPNKLQYIISRKMCDILNLQIIFDDCIDKDDRDGALKAITRFKDQFVDKDTADGNRVMEFFILRNQASFEHYFNKNDRLAQNKVSESLDISMPGWRTEPLSRYRLSTFEIENLIAYISFGDSNDELLQKDFVDSIGKYIDEKVTDEEEKAYIYPKYAWLAAKRFLKSGNPFKAVKLAEMGVNILRKYQILHFSNPLLEIIVNYGKDIDLSEPYENYVKYRDTVSFLIESFLPKGWKSDYIFANCDRASYCPDWELFKEQRIANGIRREDLLEGIYKNAESLSRVENGKQSANKSTFPKIMSKLGLEWQRNNTSLICSNYKALEKYQSIRLLIREGKHETAWGLINELKDMVDLRYRRNNVLLAHLQNEILLHEAESLPVDRRKEQIELLLKNDIEIIEMTYPGFGNKMNRILLDDEVGVVLHMAGCLKRIGKKKEAADLLKRTLECYENSYIDERCNRRWYGLILSNYGQYVDTPNMAKKALVFIACCRSLDGVGRNLCNIAIREYAVQKDKNRRKELIDHALCIAMFVRDEANYETLSSYIMTKCQD